MPASLMSSAACAAANWQCMPALAKETGGPVLGPRRDASQRILGIWVDPRLGVGEHQQRLRYYLPRAVGQAPVTVEQWDTTAPDLGLYEISDPMEVNGAAGLYSASKTGGSAGLVWQVGDRSIDVSIHQDPAKGAPTAQELVDIASSLVAYKP